MSEKTNQSKEQSLKEMTLGELRQRRFEIKEDYTEKMRKCGGFPTTEVMHLLNEISNIDSEIDSRN